MCLYLNQNIKPTTTTSDKLVFKVIELNSKGETLSWFYNKHYLEGCVYNVNMEIIVPHTPQFSNTEFRIERAFHSYRLDVPYSYTDTLYGNVMDVHAFVVGSAENVNKYIDVGSMIGVGLFAIPKGSIYYDNKGVCASNNIMYLGTRFSIQEWLSCKDKYIKKNESPEIVAEMIKEAKDSLISFKH